QVQRTHLRRHTVRGTRFFEQNRAPRTRSEPRGPGIQPDAVFHGPLKLVPYSALVAALALARPAAAATWYVSPTGTAETGCDTRANPCSLASAGAAAVAGDTVVLMDGVYKTPLVPQNSGTASAVITFRADDCATPIIEGTGVPPDMSMDDDVGVYSKTAEYVRFVGLVSRGWNEGFGNGWAGGTDSTAVSNGHWEITNCISYSNGRTGFTFFSASDF